MVSAGVAAWACVISELTEANTRKDAKPRMEFARPKRVSAPPLPPLILAIITVFKPINQ